MNNKSELMEEILTIQNKIDRLAVTEENEVMFDRMSSRKESLLAKLRKTCDPREFDTFLLSL